MSITSILLAFAGIWRAERRAGQGLRPLATLQGHEENITKHSQALSVAAKVFRHQVTEHKLCCDIVEIMQRTLILGRMVLAAAALLGVMLGLLLPAPGLHGGPSGRLITPGYSAQ